MNTNTNTIRLLLALAPASLLVCTGCATGDPEPVGDVAQAYSESSCADIGAENYTFESEASVTVPAGYTNPDCYKASIIDVADLDVQCEGFVGIQWSDALPSTPEACGNLWLGTEVYTWNGGRWTLSQQSSTPGTWGPDPFLGGPPSCHGPGQMWYLTSGQDYRFVVTARTAETSSAPTKAFTLVSERGNC